MFRGRGGSFVGGREGSGLGLEEEEEDEDGEEDRGGAASGLLSLARS
jgi:hypothetical protein